MVPELFNYKTSLLNPALKLILPFIFLYGAYSFYQARNQYSNELKKLMSVLAFAGFVGFLATLFRYLGDVFTVWKWGESLAFLLFGFASIYATWQAIGPLAMFVNKLVFDISDDFGKDSTISAESVNKLGRNHD
ncbi:MAG: hypothetical protein JEZ00_16720 [Anaerolineaceae bacterium]|nr:hypothetical protein [Anaerolineaceae bacterium]